MATSFTARTAILERGGRRAASSWSQPGDVVGRLEAIAVEQDIFLDQAEAAINTAENDIDALQTSVTSLTAEVAGVNKIVAYTLTPAQLSAAATEETLTLVTPSATKGSFLQSAMAVVNTPLSGGSVNAATLEIGRTAQFGQGADTDAYVAAQSVFTGVGGTVGHVTGQKGAENTLEANITLAATTSITATVKTTNGNVADLTAGSIIIYVSYYLAP